MTKTIERRFNQRLVEYAGFKAPSIVTDVTALEKEITELLEEYKDAPEEELLKVQPFKEYYYWYKPSKRTLQDVNELYLLEKDEYITPFFEALREINGVVLPLKEEVVDKAMGYSLYISCLECGDRKRVSFVNAEEKEKAAVKIACGRKVLSCYCEKENKYFTKEEMNTFILSNLAMYKKKEYIHPHHFLNTLSHETEYLEDESLALEALGEYGIFRAIKKVQSSEQEMFGRVHTDFSNPLEIANMLWFFTFREYVTTFQLKSEMIVEDVVEEIKKNIE